MLCFQLKLHLFNRASPVSIFRLLTVSEIVSYANCIVKRAVMSVMTSIVLYPVASSHNSRMEKSGSTIVAGCTTYPNWLTDQSYCIKSYLKLVSPLPKFFINDKTVENPDTGFFPHTPLANLTLFRSGKGPFTIAAPPRHIQSVCVDPHSHRTDQSIYLPDRAKELAEPLQCKLD